MFPISKFEQIDTPFYYYDIDLLEQTLAQINLAINGLPFHVHYAIKANANIEILKVIEKAGLGVDCVSGGELAQSLKAGFTGDNIVFAGVAKTDKEIIAGLNSGIRCFNVESLNELEVINDLAEKYDKIANVAIRVNPNVDAHTHKYITTGLRENKFGIDLELLDSVIIKAVEMKNINLCGLHFHIGSQITEDAPFVKLCHKINELIPRVEALGANIKIINVGGGLGIDYKNPDANPIPNFAGYFKVFTKNLNYQGKEVHFELGRSVVAQCGSLISRVIYVKQGVKKKFVMLDAGMSDLLRPALYQAHHNIVNITSEATDTDVYDVVGPICESSDIFGANETLPITKRGDFVALKSAGAYGEIMASRYNCRELPGSLLSK